MDMHKYVYQTWIESIPRYVPTSIIENKNDKNVFKNNISYTATEGQLGLTLLYIHWV